MGSPHQKRDTSGGGRKRRFRAARDPTQETVRKRPFCGRVIPLVEDRRAEVAEVCRRHGVERLDLFGSAAGDGFDPEESDLDFVVSFERRDPPELFDRYFGLKEELEALFGRGVDLVTEGALGKDPGFARGILGDRETLYAS